VPREFCTVDVDPAYRVIDALVSPAGRPGKHDTDGDTAMRFMTMVKGPEGVQPPPELYGAIMRLGEEAAAAGVHVDTGGLLPSATGAARIRLTGGKLTTTDGPFTESKELIGGYAFYEVDTFEQALEWATRFMKLHQDLWPGWDGETEIRQVIGPSDF
jgi:hypothetical protein